MPSHRDAPRSRTAARTPARGAADARPGGGATSRRRPSADAVAASVAGVGASPAVPTPGSNLEGGVAFIEPRVVPIQKATDLGSVQVLKHGNLFLLTDPFGDIHPDSRGLGLYHLDTRLVSCCALRVGGVRPVLLQGSMGCVLPAVG